MGKGPEAASDSGRKAESARIPTAVGIRPRSAASGSVANFPGADCSRLAADSLARVLMICQMAACDPSCSFMSGTGISGIEGM